MTTMTSVAGYDLGEELGHGAMSVVYRATRGEQAYAIKLMAPRPAADTLEVRLQFRREAAAIARLDHPSLVRVIEVGEELGRPYLVMDLVEGEGLDARIRRGALTPAETVEIARSIAAALAEVHRFGLVHRDVKPANIVLGRDGAAKLIDFGLVSEAAGSEAVVGTLAYAAPEQLGVLDRTVAAPADLYALGATLFECLTGAPPFDPDRDLFHAVATTPAPDLREQVPGISPALAAIVARLLAKDPDDRYQSAKGVKADLADLARLDEALRRGQPAPLGTHDAMVSSEQEVPLVGRKDELARAQRAWSRALRGEVVFTQVEGEGGSGKTRLIRELLATAAAQGALILGGKCHERETVPFGPLREAVDAHAARVQRLEGPEREEAVARLTAAAGELAPLVRRLSPGLARMLGDAGEVRTLDPDAEQERYYEALATFFRQLGTPAVPLVLAVDDVQWLDEGSLRVLGRLAASTSDASVLVLSTSRNGSGYEAALARYADAVGPRLTERIELKPLRLKAVNELITARLGGKPLDAHVVERLAAMTNGNPFAVGEYLRALLDAGVVRPAGGRWCADESAVEAVHLPNDVVELIIGRLDQLRAETARLAGVAGSIGGRFHLDLLARASGTPKEVVLRAVEEMARASLVEQVDADTYAFVHDRLREAAVERLGAEEQRDAHQAIAEALDGDASADLYALARHYALGRAEESPRRAAETNLEAGLKAVEDHANEHAFELLDRAIGLLRAAGLYEAHAVRLLEGLGRACAMTGRLDRAFSHLEEALRLATGTRDRFRLQHLLTLTYASQGRNDDALEALMKAFRVIGRPFPQSVVVQVVLLVGIWLWAIFLRATGLGYGKARGAEREERRVLSQLHYAGSMIALFQGRPVLMVQFIVRDFLNVHFLGATAETAIAYSVYGAVIGTFQLRAVMERYTRLGIQIAQQIGDPAAAAVCRAYQAVGTKWAGDLPRGNAMLVEVLPELNRRVPGSWYAAMMICEQAYSYLHGGLSSAAIQHVRANAPQLERTNNLMFRYNTLSVQYAELMVAGEVGEASALWEKLEEQFRPLEKTIYVGLARCIALLEVMVDRDDVGPEVDAAIDAFQELLSEDYYSNAARVLTGYARLGQYLAARPEEKPAARRRLVRATWALSLRAMVPVFRCHALILRAALARTAGRYERARKLLDRATREAQRAESRRGIFYAALERARLAADTRDPAAAFFGAHALAVATAEGWRQKARHVQAELGIAEPSPAGTRRTSTLTSGTLTRAPGKERRYVESLLQVSLASASTLDPEVQARNALGEVARVLGAERALFFLVDEVTGELALRASTGPDAAAAGISRTVIKKVMETRAPVVLTGTDDAEALGSQSIVAYGLRSIMAAPLLLRDRLVGAVYVDSRIAKALFTEDDVDLLLGLANHIAIAVETARAARVEAERSAMARDLEVAGAVQGLLLPKSPSFETGALSGTSFYQPAAQSGGDWWWHEVRPDGSSLVLVGDVSGHGAGSAMISGAVAGSFLTARSLRPDAPPERVLEELHERIRGYGGELRMTISMLELDPARGELTWWTAGAPPIFLLASGQVSPLSARGRALGDPDGFEVGRKTARFSPGDRLLVSTDGALELRRVNGRELGPRGLSKMLAALADAPIAELPARLGGQLNGLLGGRPQEDDITFVVVDAKPGRDER